MTISQVKLLRLMGEAPYRRSDSLLNDSSKLNQFMVDSDRLSAGLQVGMILALFYLTEKTIVSDCKNKRDRWETDAFTVNR